MTIAVQELIEKYIHIIEQDNIEMLLYLAYRDRYNNFEVYQLRRVLADADVCSLAESKQIAEKYSLKFVPLQAEFDKASSDGDTRYWSVDGIHPTSAGHQIIKEELQKAIEEIL